VTAAEGFYAAVAVLAGKLLEAATWRSEAVDGIADASGHGVAMWVCEAWVGGSHLNKGLAAACHLTTCGERNHRDFRILSDTWQ
jgi:hypothetical protein